MDIEDQLEDLVDSVPLFEIVKDWHLNDAEMRKDMRKDLVQRIIEIVLPNLNADTLRDKRMIDLVICTQRLEADMYSLAESIEEYYLLIAEKVYLILLNLEEKQQMLINQAKPSKKSQLQPGRKSQFSNAAAQW